MCNVPMPPDGEFLRAEASLANLMARDLNVKVEPDTLRLFIQARWDRIAALAHKIHLDVQHERENLPPPPPRPQ